MREAFVKLLKKIRKTYPPEALEIVRKAFRKADAAHRGQTRASGEPYVMHSLEVGTILASLGLDPITCAAGLLHDVLEDTQVTVAELREEFGPEIARIVDGVTKISTLNFPDDKKGYEAQQAQNIRKMLVATAKDLRVIMIKLADRLHNMRTLGYLDKESQGRISRETLDIYAPLAHRLGISPWKWELEDHAFHFLMPDTYKEISRLVAMKRKEREAYLNRTIAFLEERLTEAEVSARVIGRPKHLYSIYEKMMRQGRDYGQVMDVLGIRIITQTDAGCYNALGVIHSLWPPVPGRLKDYIAMPKLNMYQAIHTTVMRENGHSMEVQIRSEEMDRVAREGIAAHWHYKEGATHKKAKDDKLDAQLAWLQKMYDWLKDASGQDHLMDSMRHDFSSSNIYVFTPKGEVKELPQGATPLDFAYLIHSHVGHHCIGARVNNRIVPIRYNLQTGDVVEILTAKHQEPHLDWIDVVVTGRARTRIRQRLREIGMLAPLEEPRVEPKPRLPHVSPRFAPATPEVRDVDDATRRNLIRVEGLKGMAVQFARCCNPMPGHAIVGYVTKTPGITIHRTDCRSFSRTAKDASRIVRVGWEGDGLFLARLRVVTRTRPNLLADITNALRPLNIDILNAHFESTENNANNFDFQFESSDQTTIERVAKTVARVPGVINVLHTGIQERKGSGETGYGDPGEQKRIVEAG